MADHIPRVIFLAKYPPWLDCDVARSLRQSSCPLSKEADANARNIAYLWVKNMFFFKHRNRVSLQLKSIQDIDCEHALIILAHCVFRER